MATLTQPARIEDTFLLVDDVSGLSLDGIYALNDELVAVRGKPSPGARLLVGRGHLETARGTHGIGTELLPYTALSVQRVGPFRVLFDDPGVGGGFSVPILFGPPLADGVSTLAVWAVVPEAWHTDQNYGARVQIGLSSDPASILNVWLKEYPDTGPTSKWETIEPGPILGPNASSAHVHALETLDSAPVSTPSFGTPIIGLVDRAAWSDAAGQPVDAIRLACRISSTGALDSGVADIYAIIATPAS